MTPTTRLLLPREVSLQKRDYLRGLAALALGEPEWFEALRQLPDEGSAMSRFTRRSTAICGVYLWRQGLAHPSRRVVASLLQRRLLVFLRSS